MPSVEFYQRTDGKWAWRIVAGNGRIIATDGSQGYENRADAETAAALVMGGPDTPDQEDKPMTSSRNRVDVVIAAEEPDATPLTHRIIFLAETKTAGYEEARALGIEPVAIITPRSLDAARGIQADAIQASEHLTTEQRDELTTHALASLATEGE